MGVPHTRTMSFVPYARGYGYPYAGYGYGAYGAGLPYGYGPYGPSLEEVKKIREAEEKAFKEAEDRAKELMEAEKKQYEEFVEAQKKAVDDAVAKEKEFYEKERDWQSSLAQLHSHTATVLATATHTDMAASTKQTTSGWSQVMAEY